MKGTKKRSAEHVIDSKGQEIFKSCLPAHWVLREYKPDYGIDYSLEIFDKINEDDFETLGEHIYIQLKTVTSCKTRKLKLSPRKNIEIYKQYLENNDIEEIYVKKITLETSELLTVERMGMGLPVILILVDLSETQCYFVCLNDYIDKILIPENSFYGDKATKTIYIPEKNKFNKTGIGKTAVLWYGKRAKLLAAFQKFTFQENVLLERPIKNVGELEDIAMHFLNLINRYDFWSEYSICKPIRNIYHMINDIKKYGFSKMPGIIYFTDDVTEEEKIYNSINHFWRQLTNLTNMYEDIWREWFLPTYLALKTSYYDDDLYKDIS